MTETKWYQNPAVDAYVIISSRVRLARNLSSFHFPSRLSPPAAARALDVMRTAVNTGYQDGYKDPEANFINLSNMSNLDLNILAEQHLISPYMVSSSLNRGVFFDKHGDVTVMFNEEDHLRIQSIVAGDNLEAVFNGSNTMEELLSFQVDYAFDREFGFLTSCPSNTGTGMRASYMLHIPLLEGSGNLKREMATLAKAGIVMRGMHGEGSGSLGSIYQVSNQKTLGKKEADILQELKAYTNQLVEKEQALRGAMVMDYLIEAQDSFWRSLGAISNSRKMSLNEALRHLSEIRLGAMLGASLGFCKNPSSLTIYNLMVNIQPFSLQKIMGPATDARHLDVLRAQYLRETINS